VQYEISNITIGRAAWEVHIKPQHQMGYTTQTQHKPSARVKTNIEDIKIPTSYA
jgi:hypothetical protein